MRKERNWKRWFGGLCATMVLCSSTYPAIFAHANGDTHQEKVYVADYTPEALKAHEKAKSLIAKAKESKKKEDIRAAYEAFIDLTPHLNPHNYDAYIEGDIMDQVYYELEDLLFESTPENIRSQEIIRFAQMWKDVLIENINSLYVYHFQHFVINCPIQQIQGKLEEYLDEVNRWVYGTPSEDGIIPLPTDEEIEKIVEEDLKNYDPSSPFPDPVTDEEADRELEKKYPQLGGDQLVNTTIDYEKIGNDWYEIIYYISEGKVIRTERRKLSPEESYFLRVRENPYYDPSNPFADISYITPREWKHITQDQNPESQYTIHYTVNKDESRPYYYDTGIRVNRNKEATYEQYRDVLLVLADKSEGFFVRDKEKSLAVLEGRPVVIKEVKETYSKQELENQFNDFDKVEVRIMETRIGKTESLEVQIVSRQAKTVKVDGKEIQLLTLPMVKNERALLPLEEIAEVLGGKAKRDGDKFIVTKGSTTVMYRLKDNAVYVNGRRIELKNAPEYKDGVLMVEVGELATALGYRMSWDGETSTINFDSR